MPKWILHVPKVGDDGEMLMLFSREDEGLLDSWIEHFVRQTELEVRVEWL